MNRAARIHLLSYFFLLLAAHTVSAQTITSIAGWVTALNSGEPLRGVNIIVQGTDFGGATNREGRYTIPNLSPGNYTIIASMIGYERQVREGITVTADSTVHLDFSLVEQVLLLEEVIVTPGHFSLMEREPRSSSGLAAVDIRAFPQFGEDIYRSVSRLPGLASNDFSSKFYVRGGEQDEVLILLDGMELLDPFHLKEFGGGLSIIDVEVIREIDLITGAFPAEYGNRLSGVFNMVTRTPSMEQPRTSLALSFMNARYLTEGSSKDGRYRWQVLARKGYIDLILGLIGEDDNYQPGYYDLLGKVQYLASDRHMLSAHLLVSRDTMTGAENDLADTANEELLDNRYGNKYAWITWDAQYTPRLYAQTVLSAGSVFEDRLSQGYFGRTLEYEASDEHDYTFFGLKQDWNLEISDNSLQKWGFDTKRYDAVYDYHFTQIDYDQNRSYSTREVDLDPGGTEFGAYLANRFRVMSPLTVELGVRFQHASWTGDHDWNPRINVAYSAGGGTTLRAGWGRFSQVHAIDRLNMVDDDYTYYPAESAEHFVTGVEHDFPTGINLRIEGYFKSLSNLRPRYISYRYNTDTSPENSHDRIRLDPELGTSRGVEFYLHRAGWQPLKWWLNYSWSVFENEIDGGSMPREMDQRHTINADVSYHFAGKWVLNTSWHYHSGWPYTLETINIISQNPDGSWNWEWAPGPIYGERFPAYHRMDVRLSRSFPTRRGTMSVFLEIRNLYNRKNIRQYEYSNAEVLSLSHYSFTREPREWLPRIPSFGVSWEF
ncbi:TonB-dependent receptor domain-containing protein [Gemmatimonadota bacterium]